ncbi:kynurenine 3-monooxygenase [Patella vulgata]|uniref:kynurenine 3-monooxygenase n=1 Tax=Patella vulgata TaxID=6465 RepID=UPI00217FABE1|nr:kynurenine 3-monooxygenase [Patella vulgata]
MENTKNVVIVGAGLVGSLNACYLAKRGFNVKVYERRPDIRTQQHVKGRSINLALSCRGREALKMVGLEETVVHNGIPMRARMIHDLDGKRHPIPYGEKDQYIMSVDRRNLNELLLNAAEKHDNIEFVFEHKLVRCNFESGQAEFEGPDKSIKTETADLFIGCDGAFSSLRNLMMRATRLNYQQEYIPHGYIELTIQPTNNEFAMEVNYLHIWPRNEYMMIALPNQDKTYTTTLFMPFKVFESLQTEDDIIEFFKENYPDAVPLLGEGHIKQTLITTKAQSLISVKCYPYHIGSNWLIMGDAAHAMVPFYGQGMNAGFEDCIVLDELMNKYDLDFSQVLPAYTEKRHTDATAICDLAMYNYIEMRSAVNSKLFLLRKKMDNFLQKLFPNSWIPLYTMVSFTRTRYHECVARRAKQDKIIQYCGYIFLLLATGGVVVMVKGVGTDHILTTVTDRFSQLYSYIETTLHKFIL